MSESSESGNGKARKRAAAKTVTRQSSVKVEASQRLAVHAAMMSMDRSELVEKLIGDPLRRYVVSDRGGTGQGRAGQDASGAA